jgi:hypothetical protein
VRDLCVFGCASPGVTVVCRAFGVVGSALCVLSAVRAAACSGARLAGGGLISRKLARVAGSVEISPWGGLIFRKLARASGFPHISPRSRRLRGRAAVRDGSGVGMGARGWGGRP